MSINSKAANQIAVPTAVIAADFNNDKKNELRLLSEELLRDSTQASSVATGVIATRASPEAIMTGYCSSCIEGTPGFLVSTHAVAPTKISQKSNWARKTHDETISLWPLP